MLINGFGSWSTWKKSLPDWWPCLKIQTLYCLCPFKLYPLFRYWQAFQPDSRLNFSRGDWRLPCLCRTNKPSSPYQFHSTCGQGLSSMGKPISKGLRSFELRGRSKLRNVHNWIWQWRKGDVSNCSWIGLWFGCRRQKIQNQRQNDCYWSKA